MYLCVRLSYNFWPHANYPRNESCAVSKPPNVAGNLEFTLIIYLHSEQARLVNKYLVEKKVEYVILKANTSCVFLMRK